MFKAIISTMILVTAAVVILPSAGFGQDEFGPIPWWVKDDSVNNMSGMHFRGICALTDLNVWVVGENGAVYNRTGSTVHRHKWEQKNNGISADYHLNDVCFVNGDVGWTVGEKKNEPEKYKGVVYRTLNGGGLWVDITPLPVVTCSLPTPFLKVQMINTNYGYISCGNGTVLKTQNGGANWLRTTTPWADPAHPQDSIQIWYNGLWVNPNNTQELWVSGDAYGLMSHSTDGGTQWSASQSTAFNQTYDFPDSTFTPFGTRLATYDMHCTNANEGMIALSYGKLGRTVNGGSTWNTIQLEPPADSPIWFKDVIYDGAEWLACGNFGIINRYTNGQAIQENVNWRWQGDKYFSDFSCVDAATVDYAYAAGSGSGNVRQRYDPGAIQVDGAIADSEGYWQVFIPINPSILRNFRYWYCTPRLNEHLWRVQLLCPLADSDTTYTFRLNKNTVPPYCDVFYELYMETNDYSSSGNVVQEVALVTVHTDSSFHGSTSTPSGDLDVTMEDTPNDQGFSYRYGVDGQNDMTWSSFVIHDVPWSTDFYYQYQGANPGPGYRWFYDSTVQTGRAYTSRIFRIHVGQGDGFVEESSSGPEMIADDRIPDAPVFVETSCRYDSVTHTIQFTWTMENWANNPDIAGYWVCPIPPDSSRNHYHLAHSAPISRTTCRLPVDTTWIGHNAVYYVAAMDYSGHISNWSESLAVYIGSSIALSTSAEATAFNNGRKLIRIPDTDELWTTYESDNKVYTARSTDAGATWTKMLVGYGHFPVLSYDKNAEPIIPALAWQGQIESGAPVIFFSRYNGNNTWTSPSAIQTGSVGASFGPPSFAIGIGDTGHVAYEENTGSSSIKYTKFNVYNPNPGLSQTVGTGTSPSIGYLSGTGKPPIHVAWVNNNTIYYRSRSAAGWALTETVSGTLSSKQPSLEVEGNNAYVTWAENTSTGDIYWRYKVYTGMYGLWMATKRVYASGSTASIYPELSGGYSCTWVEQGTTNYEVYFATYNESSGQWNAPVNISDNSKEELFSNYPHLTYKQTVTGTTLYFVWTEGSEALRTAPPYKIKFKSKELIQGKSLAVQPLPYYVAYGGEEDPSPFNRKRDGYEQYGDEPCKRIDKANSFLEYQFETLDPDRLYGLTAYLYQRGSTNLTLSAKIDNILLGSITLPPDSLVTLNHLIPATLYADKTINLKIIGNNNQAVSAILALHEFEKNDSTGNKQANGNGPQGNESKPLTGYQLSLTVQPTHTARSLSIRYTLPQKEHVRIALYDVSGRLVKNLINDALKPGAYTLTCDTDDLGLSRGVYFLQLETKDQALVQKAVVVK